MSDGATIGTRHSALGTRVVKAAMAGLLTLVLQTGVARAQLLDLDRPRPTEPGEVRAALRFADVIEQEASAFGDTPSERARAGVRTLAITLIRTGEDAGEAGSNRVVIGMSLVRGLDELDAAITSGTLNDADRTQLAADLGLLADSLPDDPDDLDRALRDALAILMVGMDTTGGWRNDTIDGSPLAPMVRGWFADGLISDQTALDLSEFDALLDGAALQPGYARTTSWIRDRINLAAIGIDSLPDWMPTDSVVSLKASFDAGVAALCADSGDDDATAALDGIFYLSGASERVAMIKDDRIAGSVRSAIASAASDPASARDIYGPTDTLIVTLEVFNRPIPQPQVRQLRPAGRAMMGRTRRLRSDLESAIADSLVDGARSDPAALGLIARANRFDADFDLIERLDRLLTPTGDTRDKWRADAARHLLTITREMSDKNTESEAFEHLRRVGEQLERREAVLRFADELNAPSPELEAALDHLADGRRVQLAAMLMRAAGRVDRALADPAQPIPSDAVNLELRLLLRQIALIEDFLLVRSIVGLGEHIEPHDPHYPHDLSKYALAAIPSWGVSRDDLRLLLEPIESRLIQVNAALLDGDDQLRATMLPMTERDASLVRLVAWLERGARERYDDARNADSVFARVALGAPMPGSWMAEHRERLAAISRYATELAAAQRINDERSVRTLDTYVRFEATRLLNTID